jgi:transcriptional regulator with XRE-family HTH domain
VIIGDRLRDMREQKKLSQGDIEKRTGLPRCYISRVENGHTVPAIETLEKLARALEVSGLALTGGFAILTRQPPTHSSSSPKGVGRGAVEFFGVTPLIGRTSGDWAFLGRTKLC